MEDPITHEKWALFCNGWLNPEALRSGHEKPLKRRDDAEVMICLLLISFFLFFSELPGCQRRLNVLNFLEGKLRASVLGNQSSSLPAIRFADERSNYTVLQ